jgi:predicted NAD/FAD-dependent oxidoreductase
VLLGLDVRSRFDFDGAFCEESALSWVARDSSKPGRPAHGGWVLHASPAWTERHLGTDFRGVIETLAGELERMTGTALPGAVHRDAHMWRFAQPESEEGMAVPLDEGAASCWPAMRTAAAGSRTHT